jgi:hypothetical protein
MNLKSFQSGVGTVASLSPVTRVEPMRIAFSRAPDAQRDVSPLTEGAT